MVVTDDTTERDAAIEQIAAKLGVQAERGRRFAELTSLRVGGAIDWVISPKTEEQAAAFVHELEQSEIPWRPLGSGSNVLADDGEHHQLAPAHVIEHRPVACLIAVVPNHFVPSRGRPSSCAGCHRAGRRA